MTTLTPTAEAILGDISMPSAGGRGDAVLEAVAALRETLAAPVVVIEAGEVGASAGDLAWLPADASQAASAVTSPSLLRTAAAVDLPAARLPSGQTAVVVLPHFCTEPPADAVVAAADVGWSSDRLNRWWDNAAGRDADEVLRHLRTAIKLAAAEETTRRSDWELESLAEQLESTFEEISLLHFLAQNLEVSRDTDELARVCLARMRESLVCEGAVLWLHHQNGQTVFLQDGRTPYDELTLAMTLSHYDAHPWPQPLVRNHLGDTHEGGRGVRNLVVVPVMASGRQAGWAACVNAEAGREFGTVEASLVASVAVSLGTHLQNAAVLHQQEELLLSFVRSLVSSLDAKDPYTRGHSERVAAIGRRLAVEMGLPEQDVEDVYLSGLLHDVGKIGVSDAVLRKPGRLTDAEFAEIQTHPTIGYQILSGIKRLSHILPGVRSHHESIDGSGYPDGLAGSEIPTMARILAVADSYDAMGSDRPYRKGMPLEKVERILRDGAGTQWDAAIVDAYFACRDDVTAVCLEWQAKQTG